MTDLKKTTRVPAIPSAVPIAVSCLVLSVVPMMAQSKPSPVNAVPVAATMVSDGRPTAMPARPTAMANEDLVTRVIVVSLADRRLALMEDGVVTHVYRVAVGREESPSPTGTFTIVNRVENPTYYHAGEVIPPGQGNPVGTRWIGLDKKGYGIHGTNLPRSIGKAASHGCIRMRRRDLEALFAEVRSGDEVEIIGDRNEETAAIFGTPMTPATVTAPAPAIATGETTGGPTPASGRAATALVPVGQ